MDLLQVTKKEFKLLLVNAKLEGNLYNSGRCVLDITSGLSLKHYGPHSNKLTPILFQGGRGGAPGTLYFVTCRNHTKYYIDGNWKRPTEI